MMPASLPLLEVFLELRARGFSLGIPELILAQQALAQGLGTGSRARLTFLCQTLWATSRAEQVVVADVLETLLPVDGEPAELGPLPTMPDPEPVAPLPDPLPPVEDETLAPTPGDATDAPPPNEPMPTRAGRPVRFRLPARADVAIDPGLDYVGDLPVSHRQIKRAWRYYRQMRRIGPPVELDITATVQRVYRDGVLAAPVLVPRPTNLARMVILKDEGGSMVPFRLVTEPLVASALQSGLARVDVFYFHDVPGPPLYRDARLSHPIPVADLLAQGKGAGVLIVSDAGAARGNHDRERVEQTMRSHELVAGGTRRVAWLNPVPEARWPGTSAGALQSTGTVPMFALDRAGLDAAISALRGRAS